MTAYTIENAISGVLLGTYNAESSEDALNIMARDAGYESFADLKTQVEIRPNELIVRASANKTE